MTSVRIRPRFQKQLSGPPEYVATLIEEAMSNQDLDLCISRRPGHIVLSVGQEERHYWSPQLDLSLERNEDGTLIRGLYGPNPQVWTMFILGYGAISVLSFFILIIGGSRYMLDLPSGILWALPGLGVIALSLYLVGQFGQKLGAEQTFLLHHFFEDTVHERVHIE